MAQQEDVAGDSDEQVDAGDAEGPCVRVGDGDDISGDDGGGDS